MPTISVRVDAAVFKQVEALAEQWDRSRAWVVGDALGAYLEHRRWMVQETADTMARVKAGKIALIDHDDVSRDALNRAETLDQ